MAKSKSENSVSVKISRQRWTSDQDRALLLALKKGGTVEEITATLAEHDMTTGRVATRARYLRGLDERVPKPKGTGYDPTSTIESVLGAAE